MQPLEMSNRSSMDRLQGTFCKRNFKLIAGIVVTLVIVLVIIIAVAVSVKSSSSTNKQAAQAAATTNEVHASAFNPTTQQLILSPDTLPSSPLITQFLGGSTGLASLILNGAKMWPNMQALMSAVGDDGISKELQAMVAESVVNRVYTGNTNLFGQFNATCSLVFFFKPNEQVLTKENVQFALQCKSKGVFNPLVEIPALTAYKASSWIKDFVFQSNSLLTLNTCAFHSKDTKKMPDIMGRGITIWSVVKATPTASASLNNIDSLLKTPLVNIAEPAKIQIQIPLDDDASSTNIKISSTEPITAQLMLSTTGLNVGGPNDPVQISSSSLDLYIEGLYANKITKIRLSTHLVARFSGTAQGTLAINAYGYYDGLTGTITLSGDADASASTWTPFDQTLVTVSKMFADLTLTFDGVNRPTFTSGHFIAQADFTYAGIKATVSASGQFAPEGSYLIMQSVPVGDMVNMVQAALGTKKDEAGIISTNIKYRAQGSFDIVLSNFKTELIVNGRSINAGLTIFGDSVGVNNGPIQDTVSVLQKLTGDPALSVVFDMAIYIPMFGSTVPWRLMLSGRDIVVPAYGLSMKYLNFNFEVATGGAGFSKISSNCQLTLAPVKGIPPIEINADVTYDGAAAFNGKAKKITFVGAVKNWKNPFGASWLDAKSLSLSLDATFPGDGSKATFVGTFTTLIAFDFGNTRTPSVTMNARFSDQGVVLFANVANLASVHPALGTSVTGSADVYFSTFDATDGKTGLALPKGLSIFARKVTITPGAFGDSVAVLGDSTTSSFDLTCQLAYGPTASPSFNLLLNSSTIAVSSKIALKDTLFKVNVVPPTSDLPMYDASVNVATRLEATPPFNSKLVATFQGDYSSAGKSLALRGSMGPWRSPFGVSWLTIGQTDVVALFNSSKAVPSGMPSKTFSLKSSVTFDLAGVKSTISACGMLADNAVAVAIEGVTFSSLTSVICAALGICDADKVLNSIGLSNLELGITLASQKFPEGFWSAPGNLCAPKYGSPLAGLSVFGVASLQGTLADLLAKVIPTKFQANSGIWKFSVNLPFGNAPSDHEINELVARAHGLRGLGGVVSQGGFVSQSYLDDVKKFNVNFERHGLSLTLLPCFTVTGAGIIGTPLNIPTPQFSAFLEFDIALKNNNPLHFSVIGSVSIGEILLQGQMTSPAWVDPFGMKGLTVRGAFIKVGISVATAISSLGIGFDLTMGTISVTFAGSLSTTGFTSDSYLLGSIKSTTGQLMGLRDLALAVRTMSSGAINIPDAVLPSAGVLGMTNAAFSLATADGTIMDIPYKAGFSLTADVSLFLVKMKVQGGMNSRDVGMPIKAMDIWLNIQGDATAFNAAAMDWVKSVLPFDLGSWLTDNVGNSLCDLVCINTFSLTQLSVIDIMRGKFPTLTMSISVTGKPINIGPKTLDLSGLKWDAKSLFNSIKSELHLNFCAVDSNCANGQVCDHTNKNTCQAACPAGTFHESVTDTGCWSKPKIPGLGLSEHTLSLIAKHAAPEAAAHVPTILQRQRTLAVPNQAAKADGPAWFDEQNVDISDAVVYTRALLNHVLTSHGTFDEITAAAQGAERAAAHRALYASPSL